MNNPYIPFLYLLTVPLLVGFGIGYVVKPAGVQSVQAANTALIKHFHPRGQTQEKNTQEGDQLGVTRQNAITRAVAKLSPAVVGINVIAVQQIRYRDPFFTIF